MKGQKAKLAAFVARPPAREALSLEERMRRADEAMVEETGEPPTPPPQPTIGGMPTVATAPTVGKPTVEPLEKPTVATAPTVGATPPVRIAVEPKKGQLRLPNYIVFNLLPQLELAERAVYVELYAWTHGFGEPERRLSIAKLCKGLRIDYKRFMRIVAELASKGLVEMDERVIGGPRNDRGTVFRVFEPMLLGSDGVTPTVSGQPTVGTTPTMKSKKKREEEKAPGAGAPAPVSVYDVRTRAARIYEVRHRDPAFNAATLREEVWAELARDGLTVDEGTLDDAVRGMM